MGKTVTTRYDVAEHLRTPEEMAAYLEACLDEADGDAAFIAKVLGDSQLVVRQNAVAALGKIDRALVRVRRTIGDHASHLVRGTGGARLTCAEVGDDAGDVSHERWVGYDRPILRPPGPAPAR